VGGDRGKATYFLEKADIIVPKRREQLCFLIDLLPRPAKEPLTILDVDSGYGAIAEEILTRYRHSALTCVDGSDGMVMLTRPLSIRTSLDISRFTLRTPTA
jgi:trans-aconitate methyltransferase